MKKHILLIWCLLALSLSTSGMSTLDSLLTIFDNDVARAAYYRDAHSQQIDSLRNIRPMSKAIQIRIAREYQYFQSDSARVWFLKLIDAPEPYRTQAYTGLVQLSSSIGKYGEGFAIIPDVTSTPDSLSVDWIEAVWRLYSEAYAASRIPSFADFLQSQAQFYYDSLLNEMERQAPYNNHIRLRRNFLRASDANDLEGALAINDSIMALFPLWSHRYAIEAYSRSTLYERMGQRHEQ